MADIRDELKAFRKKLGLTQKEFGERFGLSGSTVSRRELKGNKNYTPIDYQPGDRYGRLTLVSESNKRTGGGSKYWECICDCGRTCLVDVRSLRSGEIQSCGCFRAERSAERAKTSEFLTPIDGTILEILNKRIAKNNTSGVKGVSFHKPSGKWLARIGFKGKYHYLGYFDTKEEAAEARRRAEKKYFQPILNENGLDLKPQENDEELFRDDTHKRRPFYDFGKGKE